MSRTSRAFADAVRLKVFWLVLPAPLEPVSPSWAPAPEVAAMTAQADNESSKGDELHEPDAPRSACFSDEATHGHDVSAPR